MNSSETTTTTNHRVDNIEHSTALPSQTTTTTTLNEESKLSETPHQNTESTSASSSKESCQNKEIDQSISNLTKQNLTVNNQQQQQPQQQSSTQTTTLTNGPNQINSTQINLSNKVDTEIKELDSKSIEQKLLLLEKQCESSNEKEQEKQPEQQQQQQQYVNSIPNHESTRLINNTVITTNTGTGNNNSNKTTTPNNHLVPDTTGAQLGPIPSAYWRILPGFFPPQPFHTPPILDMETTYATAAAPLQPPWQNDQLQTIITSYQPDSMTFEHFNYPNIGYNFTAANNFNTVGIPDYANISWSTPHPASLAASTNTANTTNNTNNLQYAAYENLVANSVTNNTNSQLDTKSSHLKFDDYYSKDKLRSSGSGVQGSGNLAYRYIAADPLMYNSAAAFAQHITDNHYSINNLYPLPLRPSNYRLNDNNNNNNNTHNSHNNHNNNNSNKSIHNNRTFRQSNSFYNSENDNNNYSITNGKVDQGKYQTTNGNNNNNAVSSKSSQLDNVSTNHNNNNGFSGNNNNNNKNEKKRYSEIVTGKRNNLSLAGANTTTDNANNSRQNEQQQSPPSHSNNDENNKMNHNEIREKNNYEFNKYNNNNNYNNKNTNFYNYNQQNQYQSNANYKPHLYYYHDQNNSNLINEMAKLSLGPRFQYKNQNNNNNNNINNNHNNNNYNTHYNSYDSNRKLRVFKNNNYNNNYSNNYGNNNYNNNYNSNNYNNNNNNQDHQYDPKDFYVNGELEKVKTSRFFVIKSYSRDDIIKSIKYNIWCSTEEGNRRLDKAFSDSQNDEYSSVYLFFSVNGSGQFCGMAQMMSRVDYDSKSEIWSQDKWQGTFEIKWLFVKDVPNIKLRQIYLPNNENKPVTNSRDTQQVPYDQAIQVLDVFRNHLRKTSILDEFDSALPTTPTTTATTTTTTPTTTSTNTTVPSSDDINRTSELAHQSNNNKTTTTTSGGQIKKINISN